MKIEFRKCEQTPFGVQETWVTSSGHIEIFNNGGGYQWRYTGLDKSASGGKEKYSSSGAALEAARKCLEI